MSELTVTQIIENVVEKMCNEYCKYPSAYDDLEALVKEHCNNCPLMKL